MVAEAPGASIGMLRLLARLSTAMPHTATVNSLRLPHTIPRVGTITAHDQAAEAVVVVSMALWAEDHQLLLRTRVTKQPVQTIFLEPVERTSRRGLLEDTSGKHLHLTPRTGAVTRMDPQQPVAVRSAASR